MKNMKEIGFSKYSVSKDGEVFSLFSQRLLTPYQSIDKAGGYVVVHMVSDCGKNKTVKVHRLVAEMYLPKVDGKNQVNHIDGNKLNNSLRNLEWVSPSENTKHAIDNNLRNPLKRFPHLKLASKDQYVINDVYAGKSIYNSDDVHLICQLLEEGYRICDVCRITGFNKNAVKNIKMNNIKKYSHIVSNYDFSKLPKYETTSLDTVIKVCKLIQNGLTNYAIADELNICRKVVEQIKNRKTYTKISNDFVW